jgi:hypothetical protein
VKISAPKSGKPWPFRGHENVTFFTEDVLSILWYPKVSLLCSQMPATYPILVQMNPVHNFPFYFFKINFNFLEKFRSFLR